MNKQTGNPINIMATGLIVMVLLSLVLFCGRFFCNTHLIYNMPLDSSRVILSTSGLIPGEPAPKRVVEEEFIRYGHVIDQNEPNFRYSMVRVYIEKYNVLFSAIGALQDITAEMAPCHDVNERVCYWSYENSGDLCFDKRTGLIIRRYKLSDPNNKSLFVDYFAGPNGISNTATPSLGRFYDPILIGSYSTDFYDKKTHCFYAIDFDKREVNKGPQLLQGDGREPIANQGGGGLWWLYGVYNEVLSISWSEPEIFHAEKDKWEPRRGFLPGEKEDYGFNEGDWTRTYIPVLDKTGRIHIYNTKEQSLTQCGYLPAPHSLFESEQQNEIANPRNVLGYIFCPVTAIRRLPADTNKLPPRFDVKYLGVCVACVSREGTAMAVAVFDPNGKLIYRGDTQTNMVTSTSSGMVSTASAVYSKSPIATTTLFLLENLQPPVFEITSYLCGDCIEASAGHRALFILPNSFVGMLGRYNGTKFDKELFLPLLMGPSLILSIWLAFRVRKDAKILGLSGTAKKWWTVGTIAFGLPAYITYRLTRPKETLVTCQNCGSMRRPDMEICHRCGSKWEVPELTPPNWRICD